MTARLGSHGALRHHPSGRPEAIEEFDRLGRTAFLQKYGFGEAKEYFLLRDGRRYDSKAIVGAAHGFDFPRQGAFHPQDFSGGEATVQRKLEQLGFEVVVEPKRGDWTPSPRGPRASERLTVGAVYTRKQLAEQFGITRCDPQHRVFQPKGFSSVWLFVTEKKTPDRRLYEDRLDGDTLHWQDQSSRRTDDLIIDHQARGPMKVQVWTALIAMLLLKYLKYLQLRSRFAWSLSNLVALLRMNLFTHAISGPGSIGHSRVPRPSS
jgi:hypothetical protein